MERYRGDPPGERKRRLKAARTRKAPPGTIGNATGYNTSIGATATAASRRKRSL